MAPEQIMGEHGDKRSDIFALGVLLYQMLTGYLPFQGESLGEVVNKILREQPQPPSNYVKVIPRQLDWLVLKALEKDPAQRFSSVEEMNLAFSEAFNPEKIAGLDTFGGNIGVLSNFFKAGHSWLRFWRDERRKFYAVALVTLVVFAWLISLQLYLDSRLNTDQKVVPPLSQFNILSPRKNNSIITNDNIKELHEQLLSLTGREVKINGLIEKVIEQKGDRVILQFSIKPTGSAENIRMLLSYDGDPHSLLSDQGLVTDVQVSGILGKIPALDRESNTMVNVPLIVSQRLELIEPWNVLAPAKMSLKVNQTLDRNGKQVTLQKIEFAETETRLFLIVKNKSLKDVMISLGNPVGIQAGRTVPQLYNLENNYQMELKPGKEIKGLVIIGSMNPLLGNAEFRLGNDLFGEEPWLFRVNW